MRPRGLTMASLLVACLRSEPPPLVPDAASVRAADASAGCGRGASPFTPGRTVAGSLSAGGRQRTFQLHLPTRYDPGRPHALVMLFHGGLGTGTQMEASARMSPIADREGFVAVYPDGVSRTWNAGACCG